MVNQLGVKGYAKGGANEYIYGLVMYDINMDNVLFHRLPQPEGALI